MYFINFLRVSVVVNMAPLTLRVFSGKASDNVDLWVAEAKRALVAAELDSAMLPEPAKKDSTTEAAHAAAVKALDRRAAAALVGFLSDAAAATGRSMSDADLASPAAFFKVLQERFQPAVSKLTALAKLKAFTRPPGASVNETWALLHELCITAQPSMPEADMVFHLMAALGPIGNQILASRGEPTKLADVLAWARDIEAASQKGAGVAATWPAWSVDGQPAVPVPTWASGGSVAAAGSSYTGGTQGVSSSGTADPTMAAILSTLRQLVAQHSSSHSSSSSQSSSSQRQSRSHSQLHLQRRRKGLCFTCGEAGHLQRECPQRAPSATTAPGVAGAAGPDFRL